MDGKTQQVGFGKHDREQVELRNLRKSRDSKFETEAMQPLRMRCDLQKWVFRQWRKLEV